MSAAVKAAPATVEAVDEELRRLQEQQRPLAEAEASAALRIDELGADLTRGVEAGSDTGETEAAILSERAALEKLALRRVALEKIITAKAAALREKRVHCRNAALEVAETSARQALSSLDSEIVEDLLTLSAKFSRRGKLEHDAFSIGARLMHLTAISRGLGNLGWDAAALVTAFLRRHPEARLAAPFGERPWRSLTIEVPVLAPDRATAALTADDEAAST